MAEDMLRLARGDLREKLHAVRSASPDIHVPELDGMMEGLAQSSQQLAAWVGKVGTAFERAGRDEGLSPTRLATVDDGSILHSAGAAPHTSHVDQVAGIARVAALAAFDVRKDVKDLWLHSRPWLDAAKKDMKYGLKAWAGVKALKTAVALVRLARTVRGLPTLMQQLYGERVGQVALAFDRGEASLAQVEEASASAMRSVEALDVFSKVGAMRAVVGGSGILRTLGRLAAPVAVVADLYTIIHPDQPGGEGTALQVAAGANAVGTIAALGVINASVDWIPVVGEVVAVATGLFLAGDWAYHNVPAFHDFCDTVGHDTVSVAKDTWHGIQHAASAVGHAASEAEHFLGSLF
jgi:hypothetical protein